MSAVVIEEQHDERVKFCECGCGEPVNLRWLRVLDLREAGVPRAQIAEQTGYAQSTVKVMLAKARRQEWPRFKLGHVGKKMARGPRKPCEFPWCGNTVPGGWRVCMDARCRLARGKVRWGQVATPEQAWREVAAGERESLLRQDRWFYIPLPVRREFEALSDAIADARTDVTRRAYEARLVDLQRDRQAKNREQVQIALAALREGETARRTRLADQRALWMAARELLRAERRAERREDPDRLLGFVSLDTSLSEGGVSRKERLPGADIDLLDQIDTTPRTIAEVQALIRDLPIVPGDWLRRLREGDFILLFEDDGPVFVEHHKIGDAVPWRDAPGPLPMLALGGGTNHGRGSSRKQHQKLARGSRGHPSRKAKARA